MTLSRYRRTPLSPSRSPIIPGAAAVDVVHSSKPTHFRLDVHGTRLLAMFVIVARHGEGEPDACRQHADYNWAATADRPWDPPLTEIGHSQAERLHEELLKTYDIQAVYSSPLLQCRETASYGEKKVKVEPGLMESMSEGWYRSWALPGSNGLMGYMIDEKPAFDPATVHPAAKEPIQNLLDFKQAIVLDEEEMDLDYVPKTSVDEPYSFDPPRFESDEDRRRRARQVMDAWVQPDGAVLLVSHGEFVTVIYEALTGNPWTKHGSSTDGCYSVYKKEDDGSWTTVKVNKTDYLYKKIKYVLKGKPGAGKRKR